MRSKNDIKNDFLNIQSSYSRLGINLEEALKSFLNEKEIPYLNVYHRVKEFESFHEKIGRKDYSNPFDQIEDICGIRIICYYASDISKIEDIIKKEFKVLDSEDKSESLGLKEFAYRSIHKIVKINKSWVATPNYRGLQNLKCEIQIRTILMHAWAEVEHKLNYKSDAQVPSHFQRKLFRLSAKFEEADEQFEEIKNGISEYRASIKDKAISENKFDISQDFNRDSFLEFLNFHFDNFPPIDEYRLENTFDDLLKHKIDFKELEEMINKIKPYQTEIANDLKIGGYMNEIIDMPTEFIGFALQIFNRNSSKGTMNAWKNAVNKWSKVLI